MKDIEEFIETLVNIEEIPENVGGEKGNYGHFPFALFAETKDGSYEIGALALGGDVVSCYKQAKKHIDAGARRVYLSLDFPATPDIKNDFVGVFSVDITGVNLVLLPYNIDTGELYKRVVSGPTHEMLLQNFAILA